MDVKEDRRMGRGCTTAAGRRGSWTRRPRAILLVLGRRGFPRLLAPHRFVREVVTSQSPHKRLGLVLLVMVIAQGVLGAITVKYKLPWFVPTAHLVLAMRYDTLVARIAAGYT